MRVNGLMTKLMTKLKTRVKTTCLQICHQALFGHETLIFTGCHHNNEDKGGRGKYDSYPFVLKKAILRLSTNPACGPLRITGFPPDGTCLACSFSNGGLPKNLSVVIFASHWFCWVADYRKAHAKN